MAIRINSNIASLNAQRNLGLSNVQLNKTLERLSSGLRINRAADDAALVAGAQVTVLGEGLAGLVRFLVVTGHHVGPPDEDLAVRGDALLDPHADRSTCGELHQDIAALANSPQDLTEGLAVLGRRPVIPSAMHVHHRRA